MSGALRDQVALVTGGSRGIGLAIGRRLAEAGARVVLASRSAEAARRAASEIAGPTREVHGIEMDVSRDESVESASKSLLGDYGTIPLLVNGAGVTRDTLLLRMKKDDWQVVLETNLSGIYRTCRAFAPAMVRARYGRIVNITSVVASTGNPGQVNYGAAKAGVEGLTRSLARELASRNITVNCVAPGFIDTDMTRALGDDARSKLLERVPMGRLGQPEDVAAAVAFLVGPGADYITGTTLKVNGGMEM